MLGGLRAAAYEWGSTPAERSRAYPCDRLVEAAEVVAFRAVDVAAPPAITFRWLCQLRVAPYSYDWLDNRGRRSPRELTPGAEDLEAGQRLMTIFRLESFEPGRHITGTLRGHPAFGDVAATYWVDPAPGGSRLVVKLLAAAPRGGLIRAVYRVGLPYGDLVMMRKQLLTLKRLAEQGPREAGA